MPTPKSRLKLVDLSAGTPAKQSENAADRIVELVVEAISRRDANGAARLMGRHIASVERNLRTNPETGDLSQILRRPD